MLKKVIEALNAFSLLKPVVQRLLEAGITVFVLSAILVGGAVFSYLEYSKHEERQVVVNANQNEAIEQLRREVAVCNQRTRELYEKIILQYQEEQKKTNELITRATMVLEKMEKKIK